MPTQSQDKSTSKSLWTETPTPDIDPGHDDPVYYRAVDMPTEPRDSVIDNNPASTETPIKALLTVRDHTTDQLNHEQDEFVPREYDSSGETKISPLGELLGGRTFNIRAFVIGYRGEKRFMLATECARVLGYRASYLLYKKNRTLHKIIATQQDKDDLIDREILPYLYRSRAIALVTAKSMFRQFGARIIEGGRRVRDDYWEAKAIQQGFTEEDMPDNQRPTVAESMVSLSAGYPSSGNSKAVQDYQMQMMLLEQHKKQQLLMARRELDTMSGSGGAASGPRLSDVP